MNDQICNVLTTGDVADLLSDSLGIEVNKNSVNILQLNSKHLQAFKTYALIAVVLIDVGNRFLRNGNVDSAIKCYNEALNLGDPAQEGILHFMRGTAHLQRSYSLR